MHIKHITHNLFDVFYNDGWNSFVRFRKTKHGLIIYKRSKELPKDYLDLLETKLLLDEVIGK
jgi:hypothetical protein